jgi:AbrB family looped-hinge helix DNA binding protein
MQVLPQKTSTDAQEFVGSVSAKGQITLPKPVRAVLGIKPKDKIAIRLEAGEVKVAPVNATLDAIYQMGGALKKPLTDKEMSQIAWEEQALSVAQEGA